MRPSTEAKVSSITNRVITGAVGLFFLAGGAFALYLELRTPPSHSGHIYFFGGLAIFGALMIRPDPIFSIVQRVIVVAGQTNLPFVGGGRRAGDNPPSNPPADPK